MAASSSSVKAVLSAALAFDEPGASATGDSDDEVVVLPPPPPRAPLDVILLDNSDISDDELVLDTNTECPERMPGELEHKWQQ